MREEIIETIKALILVGKDMIIAFYELATTPQMMPFTIISIIILIIEVCIGKRGKQ